MTMHEADAFFTHTIVGAPLSISMGRRLSRRSRSAQGILVDLSSGESRLSVAWRDWVVTSHACDPVGQPRLRPSRWRRKLERHALLIAVAGLLSLGSTVVILGWTAWM